MKIKPSKIIFILLVILFCTGQVSGQITDDISNAIYLNPSFIKEPAPKSNCELNGAWSTEYSYYWLADPANSQLKLPSYVTNISYSGVIQEVNSVSISTPESISSNNSKRNKYYLSSSLDGETLQITIDLKNPNDFVTWLPISLYLDPFVINDPNEQIKLSLSYASSSLGNIVYIQNTKFNAGCYLNLLVKSPTPGAIGKITIEITPNDNSKAAISGIFWSEPRKESNLKVTYTGADKISAPIWQQNLKNNSGITIWSPNSGNDPGNLVRIGLGKTTIATSTGYEFPSTLRSQGFYNFNVLQGMAGPQGINGLEFYLNPDNSLCLNGCNLGLYFTESYKQNISIYSAEDNKENKLLTTTDTPGDRTPAFQNFHIEPNNNIKLRVRVTTNDTTSPPVLRGLYISSAVINNINDSKNNPVLSTDQKTPVETKDPKINTQDKPVSSSTIVLPYPIIPIIQIPQINITVPQVNNISSNNITTSTTRPNNTIQTTISLLPLAASQSTSSKDTTNNNTDTIKTPQLITSQPSTNTTVTISQPVTNPPIISNTNNSDVTKPLQPTISQVSTNTTVTIPQPVTNPQTISNTNPSVITPINNTDTNQTQPPVKYGPGIIGDLLNTLTTKENNNKDNSNNIPSKENEKSDAPPIQAISESNPTIPQPVIITPPRPVIQNPRPVILPPLPMPQLPSFIQPESAHSAPIVSQQDDKPKSNDDIKVDQNKSYGDI